MILRRIAENLRARDWSTVAAEILIVVVGIFVGLEVSNWNEERKFAAQEQSYLGQLRDEILHNNRAIAYQVRYTNAIIETGQRALAWLDGDGDCASRCADLLVDLFHASQVWGTSVQTSTFVEVERLGFPSDAAVAGAVQRYYLYIDGWDLVNSFAPAYRENLRGHVPPQAFMHLWQDCYRINDGQLEELTRDCVSDLSSLDLRSVMHDIHADAGLRPQLRFWLGQNIYAAKAYPGMQAHGEAAAEAISNVLSPAQ